LEPPINYEIWTFREKTLIIIVDPPTASFFARTCHSGAFCAVRNACFWVRTHECRTPGGGSQQWKNKNHPIRLLSAHFKK
jgi:hypothetical protein